jgi:hypothetical protein
MWWILFLISNHQAGRRFAFIPKYSFFEGMSKHSMIRAKADKVAADACICRRLKNMYIAAMNEIHPAHLRYLKNRESHDRGYAVGYE